MQIGPLPVVRAAVVASSWRCEYQVAGRGRPLVLLAAEPARLPLITRFAAGFRVYAPDVQALDAPSLTEGREGDPRSPPCRLGLLLDGLGMESVVLAVTGDCADIGLAHADCCRERVERFVVLPAGDIDFDAPISSLVRHGSAGGAMPDVPR